MKEEEESECNSIQYFAGVLDKQLLNSTRQATLNSQYINGYQSTVEVDDHGCSKFVLTKAQSVWYY